ncbi:MAG: FlaD/FlaE family flagellar protein [Candidatus Nanoarchaeia archaeon]
MALGIIQFLLGGKNNKAKSKETQTSSVPVANTQNNNNNNNNNQVQQNQDSNSSEQKLQESTKQEQSQNQQNNFSNQQQASLKPVGGGNKKSVSEVLMKMHKEMKESNERITGLVTDIKKIENSVNSLTTRVEELDKKSKENDSKIKEFDNNMSQFLSLYELINNQYNPFVSQEDLPKKVGSVEVSQEQKKEELIEENNNEPLEIEIPQEDSNSNGTVLQRDDDEFKLKDNVENTKSSEMRIPQREANPEIIAIAPEQKEEKKISSSLLELDTLNIEEAAADAVPLTVLKNNTNALVIILSWLEYLIKRVGIEETRNTLRYYTETLRWMTPEVFFDLDKYLRGMSDTHKPLRHKTNVKDHIVSLYFISKLNEKSLDEKLTKAVLEIIGE